jgi:hypothetical protein
MTKTHPVSLCITVLALCLCSPAQENLAMGKMWTFENPPLAYLEEEYGFTPSDDWLASLRLASLRFGGGCSASFVSPKGLIMTNHHCVRDHVAEIQNGNDWVTDGFYATSRTDEVRIPGLAVEQLISMDDVTVRMNEGVTEEDDDTAISERRAANRFEILESAAKKHPKLRAQVVALFKGAVFKLYLYKVYDDIRLVCTPHLQTSHFGGDPDNFTYPRYSIDFSFCRAYEDGEPADTSGHYFRWSTEGPQKGELVFVPGNPGTTNRLQTVAQLEHMRDVEYPIVLGLIQGQRRVLEQFAAANPDLQKRFRTAILSLANSDKAYTGYLGGLLNEDLMAEKSKLEQSFRHQVDAVPELRAKYSQVWDELAKVARKRTELGPLVSFHTPLLNTGALAKALAVLRALDPDTSPDARAGARILAIRTGTRISPVAEAVFLDHLARTRQWLDPNDSYLQEVMGDLEPADALARLQETRLRQEAYVEELLDGGMEAVAKSDDPAVSAARILHPLMAQHRALSARLDAREEVLGTKLGQALHAVYGNKVSPDATFTLRFSDGVVKGYPFNGTVAPFRTTFYGLYGRNADFDGEHPFDLPEIWIARRDKVDMNKGVNFVSTNDLIGGNSGSPVVNKDLEVVGLVFDGNIEMLPNNFLYRGDVPRSVAVHVEGIMEALRKVYDAERVADELIGK